MPRRTAAVALAFAVALGAAPAHAAQNAARKAADAPALRPEQQHAWGLVESLAAQTDAIGDDALRVRVRIRLADVLWDRDPSRARKLFRRAFDESDAIESDEGQLFGGALRALVRAELVARVYRRDPALASRFAREIEDDRDAGVGAGPFEDSSERGEVLAQVAIGLTRTDPSAAAELGRQSLATGIARGLPALLSALSEADRALADGLAAAALDSVDVDDPDAFRVLMLAGYCLPSLYPQLPGAAPGAKTNPALASAYLRRVAEVVERSAAPALERGAPEAGVASRLLPMGYATLSSLVPAFELYDPEGLPEVRALVARLGGAMDPSLRDEVDTFVTPREDTPEALLSRAESTGNADERERLIGAAASMAMARGAEYPDVKAIISKLAAESPFRRALLEQAARRAAQRATAAGRYDDAQRIASDIADPVVRADVLTDVALRILAAGDGARAEEVLDEAVRAAAKADAASAGTRARALARVAAAYASADPLRGFEVVQDAIKPLNAAARELASEAGSGGPDVSALDQDLGTAFEALGRADYFRALLLAQSLDGKATTILCQLAAAQGALRFRGPRVVAPADAPRPSRPKPAPPAAAPRPTPAP